MTWTITGNSDGLVLGVTKHGNPVVRGIGSHVPYFREDPAGPALRSDYTAIQSALRRLQTVKTDWRIVSSAVAREEFGSLHPDLVARIDSQPNASIVEIACIDREKDEEPALSFQVILQPLAFQQAHKLFAELITGPRGIEYTISVGFLTFRYPG
ncbi:MAG: hypothetical protein ABI728_15635, partial [Betaproteobacteria bacterium]